MKINSFLKSATFISLLFCNVNCNLSANPTPEEVAEIAGQVLEVAGNAINGTCPDCVRNTSDIKKLIFITYFTSLATLFQTTRIINKLTKIKGLPSRTRRQPRPGKVRVRPSQEMV